MAQRQRGSALLPPFSEGADERRFRNQPGPETSFDTLAKRRTATVAIKRRTNGLVSEYDSYK